jgi:hypothetical protein
MNLAAIFGFYLFSLGFLTAGAQSAAQSAAPASDSSTQQTQSKDSQPQTEPKQSSEPALPPTTGSSEATKPATPAKPPHARSKRHKKAVPANCSNAPTATNTAMSDPSASTGAENATTPTLPPCPTPKKVVRNGGSAEPSIQLVGGGTAGQTAQQRTIDQLTAATTENLKKLEGRQLDPTQQDMVSQIKQFMDQSKTAVAAGDLERGNNLATKARLLSDELVKP